MGVQRWGAWQRRGGFPPVECWALGDSPARVQRSVCKMRSKQRASVRRPAAMKASQELTMNFVAFERAKQGTGASRRLRNSGKTPGIVYGGTTEPQLIEVDHNALWHALKKEAFHSSVLDMEVAGTTAKVLLRD
eukprot:gene1323-1847_t